MNKKDLMNIRYYLERLKTLYEIERLNAVNLNEKEIGDLIIIDKTRDISEIQMLLDTIMSEAESKK